MEKKLLSYKELEEQMSNVYIPYAIKLKTADWILRRETILVRDKFVCQICQERHSKIINGIPYINYTEEEEQNFIEKVDQILLQFKNSFGNNFIISEGKAPLHEDLKPKYLHVHHKYYLINSLPWEYPDDALISLCGTCHQNIHDNEDIPVFNDVSKNVKISLKKCSKCNGSGYISKYYYHMDGICFKCEGNRFEEKW